MLATAARSQPDLIMASQLPPSVQSSPAYLQRLPLRYQPCQPTDGHAAEDGDQVAAPPSMPSLAVPLDDSTDAVYQQLAVPEITASAPAGEAPVDAVYTFVVICAKYPARPLHLFADGKVRFNGGHSHGSWYRCPIDQSVIHITWNWAADESKLKTHAYRNVATTDCWEPEKISEEFWHILALSRSIFF